MVPGAVGGLARDPRPAAAARGRKGREDGHRCRAREGPAQDEEHQELGRAPPPPPPRRARPIRPAAAVLLLGAGCATAPAPASDRDLTVSEGATFTVALDRRAGTGYGWMVDGADAQAR